MHRPMISRRYKIVLFAGFGVVGAMVIGGLHFDNVRLRARGTEARRQHERIEHLREENCRVQELLARAQTDEADAARAVRAEVVRVRAEVAALQQRAAELHGRLAAKGAAEAEALANNRDPQSGLTRLEHFRESGQTTPGAAFQTLGWAAWHGDAAALARVSTITAGARAKAEALIAGLPESARGQWSPEKLAAMFFTGAFGEVTAAHVVTETTQDPQHVALKVRISGGAKEATIPLLAQRGSDGWQIVFDEKLLSAVQKKIANALPPAAKK